jgi:hypothetical protein
MHRIEWNSRQLPYIYMLWVGAAGPPLFFLHLEIIPPPSNLSRAFQLALTAYISGAQYNNLILDQSSSVLFHASPASSTYSLYRHFRIRLFGQFLYFISLLQLFGTNLGLPFKTTLVCLL